jgi:KDO2-lipid IV(A) lauroyltransferase
MVRAVRLNQWVVGGEKLEVSELDKRVQLTYRNISRGIFDLYRTLGRPQKMKDIIKMTPDYESIIERSARGVDGVIVVSAHMNQFDLMALYGAYRGAKLFGLMYPDPGGGYEWQNKIRVDAGLEAYPTSRASLREALKRLRSGGTVVTAVDRPIPETSQLPNFFGRKAPLPLHYIMLALRADVPVVVAVNILGDDGRYELKASESIQMERLADRSTQMLVNAERVLLKVEEFIAAAPDQWAMAYPVWPDVEQSVP